MTTHFKKIAVFGKRGNTAVEPLNRIRELIESMGLEVLFERSTAKALGLPGGFDLAEIGERADMAVIFGGDGTMLGISRRLARFNIPFVGINAGHLGFITDIPANDYEKELVEILNGNYSIDSRLMVQAELLRECKSIYQNIALNDIVISRGISGSMLEFTIQIDSQPMSVQRSDGLIIATPTGSTAYALSCGGPIIHPTVSGMLMVPVAPHTLTNRPILVPETSIIDIQISDIGDGALYYDMQDQMQVQQDDIVRISRYPHPMHFMHPKNHNFYDTLRQKLHWNFMLTSLDSH